MLISQQKNSIYYINLIGKSYKTEVKNITSGSDAL